MYSMTGFGRADGRGSAFTVSVEVRSENHRNLSMSLRLPDTLSEMDPVVRRSLRNMFSRGRIRVDCSLEAVGADGSGLSLNTDAGRAYLAAAEKLKKELGAGGDIPVADLLRLPGVMESADISGVDSSELSETFETVLDQALQKLQRTRAAEGLGLEKVFREGLESIRQLAIPVMEAQKASAGRRFRRLKERVAELASDITLDQDRMLQELALIADRSDATEELQRLLSHSDHAMETLELIEQPVGRKLEFILQEMHRELNTMGAKVDDAELSVDIVQMKSILASLKEQAANVE
ncbi:MAG: YicC/YloC family endoribonuclease [Candidatus Aegiribacteria sp.]